MELINRPRRLRQNDSIRRLCRETRLSPDSLIYPIFVDETLKGKRAIPALAGQFHYGLDAVCEAVEECIQAGVGRCILFGLPARKDAVGSSAWDEHGVVQEAIRTIKAKYPDFYVITDVCMCEYTTTATAVSSGATRWTTTRPWRSWPRRHSPTPRPAPTWWRPPT